MDSSSTPQLSRPLAALTIAGSDSGGGAGVQADLRTFAAHGLLGCSAITALTAQNTLGVTAVEGVSPAMVKAQIAAVLSDLPVAAIKTGMLKDAATIEAVADALDSAPRTLPLVIDPVMIATSGDRLLDASAVEVLIRRLLPLATVITPNLSEARALCRASDASHASDTGPERLARMLANLAPHATVVVTGGDSDASTAVDTLMTPDGVLTQVSSRRVETRSTHGTGCAMSAAIASHLALGRSPVDAIELAKRFITGALQHAVPMGAGHGPPDHLWQLRAMEPPPA